jgi:hypothetical protein
MVAAALNPTQLQGRSPSKFHPGQIYAPPSTALQLAPLYFDPSGVSLLCLHPRSMNSIYTSNCNPHINCLPQRMLLHDVLKDSLRFHLPKQSSIAVRAYPLAWDPYAFCYPGDTYESLLTQSCVHNPTAQLLLRAIPFHDSKYTVYLDSDP